jgi:hypothetical protein
MLVKCLYCDSTNDAAATGGYCDSCGKKLPEAALVRPRRTIGGIETAVGSAPEPLPRNRAVAFEALVAAAVVHLVLGGVFLILGAWLYARPPEHFGPLVLSWTVVPTLVLAGLAWLARYQPEPSVWIALGLWALWVAASFLLHPTLALGWSIIHVALLAMLLRAAWLALRPRPGPGT